VKDAEQVLIESPQQWRDWLAEHHATSSGIWLVMWRPASGKPHVTYEQAIEEALCYGWIDGQAKTIDTDRIKPAGKIGKGSEQRRKLCSHRNTDSLFHFADHLDHLTFDFRRPCERIACRVVQIQFHCVRPRLFDLTSV